MPGLTSIKVPTELRDRLAELARRQHATLAATITSALDLAEEAEFWTRVRDSMPIDPAVELDDKAVAGTLSDGLDPDERWDEIL